MKRFFLQPGGVTIIKLLLCCCILFCSSTGADDTTGNGDVLYTAISPSELRPFSTYTIVTTLEEANSPAKFQFSIVSGGNDTTIVSTEETLEPQEQKLVTLDIPALEKSQYNLSVKVFQVDGGKVISEERTILERQFRNSTILIQTDKPIYKPSETVKFRVFLLSRDFQPFQTSRKVDITLRDPQSNIIKSWKSAEIKGDRGFLSESVELSSEPNLGDWTIQVDFDEGKVIEEKTIQESPAVDQQSPALKAASPNSLSNQRFRPRPIRRREEIPLLTETFSFTVDQYVLPKYNVDVKLSPTFVTYNSSLITAEVSATYTFGKPVTGKCTLVLNNPNIYSYRPKEEQANKITQVSKALHLEEGKGRAFVEFDVTKDLNVLPEEVTSYGRDYKIDISCVDSVSSKVRNTSATFRMHKLPYKAELVEGSREDLKPGLPYFVKVRVTFQDGRPVEDPNPMALKIEHMFNLSAENSVLYSSIDKLGESSTNFQVPTNPRLCYSEGIQVTYKDLSQTLYLGRKIVSSTGNYLQLSSPHSPPEEGAQVTLDLHQSKPYSRLNLLVISKGKIVHNDLLKLADPENLSRQLSLTLPKGSSPSVKVIVYTVAPETNDVVADLAEFDVRQSGKIELNLSLSEQTAEPGTNVTLKVKGLPNSIFGLRAVDTSVLLLKKDNDLSQEKLTSAARAFNPNANYWGGGYVYQQISRAGLDLLTNAVVEKPSRPQYEAESYFSLNKVSMDYMSSAGIAGPPGGAFAAAPVRVSGNGGGGGASSPRVRSNFVETWIWEEVDSLDGETILHKTVPDTITSWSISAFQLNAEEGLGLTGAPSKLTVFRPFFVALNLPYSIVKGEVLGLQVLLHNYLEVPVETQVTLENDNGFFKFLEKEGEDDVTSLSKTIKLNASSVSSVTFPISAVKFGTANLRVKAVSDAAGDAVTVPLIVRPPGIKHTQNNAVFLNLLEESKSPLSQQVAPVFPENRVEGADSVRVSVIGDILGGTMSNLQRLIQLPSGCGEQNMLHFVPDVVILEYLNATGGITPEIQERTLRYLSSGYQRQLTFLRHDGSFSAFGHSDNVGSTWLTAFVTRWFIRAKNYIPIDESVIHKSLKFLVNAQNDNGSFVEEGRVYDKSLQGGSGSNQYALTAFTLLTFHAAKKAGIDLKKATEGNFTSNEVIANGTAFIVNGTSEGQLKDPYGNSLIAYLFAELGHPEAERYFKLTEDAAKIDLKTGLKHWEALKPRRRPADDDKFPEVILRQFWEPKTKPSSVETTAYALLTSVLRGNLSDDTFAIARWLLKQRNAQGGFISTQDTVVGISALASFAAALQTQQNAKAEMKVDVNIGDDKAAATTPAAHSFQIEKDSLTTLQEFILPLNDSTSANTKEVTLTATGKGTALAQLTWSYYIEAEDASPSFSINIDVKSKDKGRIFDLRICSSVVRGEDSNMAILELTAPSGYVFDEEELETLRIEKRAFRRYETEDRDSRVSLYFDSISSSDICVSLNVYRVFLVAQQANATAVLYDYYDTTRRAQQSYSIPQVPICDLCASDNSCKLKNCA